MVKFTPEEMRARFWELTTAREAVLVKSAPAKKLRDDLKEKLRDPLAAFKAAKVAVNKIERVALGEIDREMAMLARALSQKVGPRPS